MSEFKIIKKSNNTKARIGAFQTKHGQVLTPDYTFVATEGSIKAIPKEKLQKLPVKLIIVNTFHIYAGKILEKVENIGGIHKYADFPGVIMSDSGGFQVFSLGFGKIHGLGKVVTNNVGTYCNTSLQKMSFDLHNPLIITEEGVSFTYNNEKITLSPEKSMEIQRKIGADIIFAFDECTSPLNSYEYTKDSMERTHRWLIRSIKAHKKSHALFGIVQGGEYENLRQISAKFVGKQDLSGFGIGGSLGKYKEDTYKALDWTIPYLPEDKPRHFLGIGRVRDVLEGVERGIDHFDCVIPTREARHKVIYTFKGKVNLRKMRNIDEIIDKDCQCETCVNGITYKKLHNVIASERRERGNLVGIASSQAPRNDSGFFYATVHNIQFFSDLMKKIREAIENNRFLELKVKILRYY